LLRITTNKRKIYPDLFLTKNRAVFPLFIVSINRFKTGDTKNDEMY